MTPAQNSTAAVDHQAPGLINAPSTGVTAASSDVLKSVGPLVMLTNFILVGLVAVFIGWSAWAVLDEVTVGEGRVIPSRKIQLVQNLEGGIIKEILAREGALVEKGDVVLRIDPTGADAQLGEDREKIIGLDLRARRLTAEIEGRELNFPQDIRESHAELVLGQEQEFASRAQERRAMLASLDDQILQREQQVLETQAKLQGLEKTLSAVRREHGVTAPLVRMGAASRVDVMRLDGRIAELTGELQSTQFALPRHEAAVEEAKNDRQHKQRAWEGKTLKELNEVRVELAALRQSQLANQDKVARTDMRAPARGLIKRMYVTTVGQVVKPGMDLIEIVPLDDTLLVQTKIRPQDIAFLRPGQPATVKLTAYDYTIYGSLAGKLERISADAIETERGETFYLADIRTDAAQLVVEGKNLPIIPGMVASVDLFTGQKTVLQYLIKPFTRLTGEALRER